MCEVVVLLTHMITTVYVTINVGAGGVPILKRITYDFIGHHKRENINLCMLVVHFDHTAFSKLDQFQGHPGVEQS